MKLATAFVVSITCVACLVDGACNPPVPAGSTWVANQGCINSATGTLLGAYCVPGTTTATTNGTRCHCWGGCGYICDPNSPLCPPPPTTTTTKATTTTTPKPCTLTCTGCTSLNPLTCQSCVCK